MRSTVFCKHYRAMSEHDTCKAGVAYETLKGLKWEDRPCFANRGELARPGCDLVELPTPDELAARDAENRKRFESTVIARQAIVDHLGGPWKKGTAGAAGEIDCPVCTNGKLRFSRAGYNGHIHAGCTTKGCVCWIE